ncbi:putative efflux pump periplasmic linker TtgA precursor [Pseudovibrio axinellae]|uniref:Putative efflux pump periplasmic linker TtgA n=1 Tax=Pseudovibrio axinellae TaxID=989403 RepID=A0A165XN16_9HYPH|nr:efflux RND transporter periplasmic adaptor subunit [Pseudovibrio axinellae]KZL17874.1 putative efflux pump periplasmic linker TtgA precursor [Pseudovibrio axinellae]SER87314.1 RND family efflux transporter, MFP subunit [Pseudovibrio axinellae]
MLRLHSYIVSAGVLLLGLASCGEAPHTSAPEVVRPVKTFEVLTPESGGKRSFPARIESQRRAEVSFRVPGTIVELPVKEGEAIEKGETIAQLDSTDFELVVQEREAELFRADRDFERIKPLAERGFSTVREKDRREYNLKSAKASLDMAKQDLAYTTLKAPFDGRIAKRLVENYEEVQAKEVIIELRDLKALEVKFDVPEQIMLLVREASEELKETRIEPDVIVFFDAAPNNRYALEFKEVAATADPATRTFEATYIMPTPDDINVLPGMTANVVIDLTKYIRAANVTFIPSEAVMSTNDLEPHVWIVNAESRALEKRHIKVGDLRGNQIAVTDGLEPGDRIVTAGVPFLVEGMKVSLMSTQEQAEERPEDVSIRKSAEEKAQSSQTPAAGGEDEKPE